MVNFFGDTTTPEQLALEKKAYERTKKKEESLYQKELKQRAIQKGQEQAKKEIAKKKFYANLGRNIKEKTITGAKFLGRQSGKAVVSVAKGIYHSAEGGGKAVGREEKSYLQSRFGKAPRRTQFRRTIRTSYGDNDPYNFLLGAPSRRERYERREEPMNYANLITGGYSGRSSRHSDDMLGFGSIDPLGTMSAPRRTVHRRKKKAHKQQSITLVLGGNK